MFGAPNIKLDAINYEYNINIILYRTLYYALRSLITKAAGAQSVHYGILYAISNCSLKKTKDYGYDTTPDIHLLWDR
jgi:hypothetical protein